jgi:hypothetical protein
MVPSVQVATAVDSRGWTPGGFLGGQEATGLTIELCRCGADLCDQAGWTPAGVASPNLRLSVARSGASAPRIRKGLGRTRDNCSHEVNGAFTLVTYATHMSLAHETDLSDGIQDHRLLELYWYWRDRKGARRHPRRCDIDPLDLRYVLGHIMMIDVLGSHPRFRVRLHGTEMVERAGYDLTGKYLEDLPNPEYRSYVLKRCAELADTGVPEVVQHDRILDGEIRRYEALWLPFSEDDRQITMLLCALIYDRQH